MERRPPRKRGNAAQQQTITKEMKKWQECSYTTTASSPTRTPG